jgi:hypothetical protein
MNYGAGTGFVREPGQTDQQFADAIACECGENMYVAINHENDTVYLVRVADDPIENPGDGEGFLIGLCEIES